MAIKRYSLILKSIPHSFELVRDVFFGRAARHFALLVPLMVGLLLSAACDTYCISDGELLWGASDEEYRLEITNKSSYMVELKVDGESQGTYCRGVEKLPVGNFERSDCSRITVVFLDNPDSLHLDDCDIFSPEECRANNINGNTCYDTSLVEKVEARVE